MPARTLAAALLVLGCVLLAATTGFSGRTDRQCDVDSAVYDTVGVDPGAVAITGLDVGAGQLEWYDGCNWHTGPLALFAAAGLSLAGGAGLGLRPVLSRRRSS